MTAEQREYDQVLGRWVTEGESREADAYAAGLGGTYATLGELREEIAGMRADIVALNATVAELAGKIDQAQGQVARVVELAAPAIEQIAASPIMKMLGGKK
jgi:hypothetical protein